MAEEQTQKCVSRTEQRRNPEVNSHKYAQPIFETGAKAIQRRKDSISNSAGATRDIQAKTEPQPVQHLM